MKRIMITFIFVFLQFISLSGDIKVNEGDSVVEFPVIVIVGQVVEITPFSIIFENTYQGTNVTDEQINKIIEYYSSSVDFRDRKSVV